jgi:hypothetical protein
VSEATGTHDGERSPAPSSAPLESDEGRPRRVELRQPDRYGTLLILIVATMFAPVFAGSSRLGSIVAVSIAAVMLIFALHTSVADPWVRRIGWILTGLLVLTTAYTSGLDGTTGRVGIPVGTAILVVAALAAVGRRLFRHHDITGKTILGAVCIYLLLGLLFAAMYAAFAAGGRAFAQHPGGEPLDFVYFSFITLATVGYGDLSPGTDIVRVLAMIEGLLGQLYLVTVIAVLVSNVGRRPRT